jgi:hypothetical protein
MNKKDWKIVNLELRDLGIHISLPEPWHGHLVAEVPRHGISAVEERESPLH